jgi:hypothetical protein
MKQRLRSRCVAALVAAISAAPCAYGGFEPDAAQPYREFFDPDNPVKGEALLGLSIVPANSDVQLSNKLSVWFGQHYDGPLSVETLAADGRFRGVGSFTGSTDQIGWNAVPLKPELDQGKVRPTDPVALAVAVRGRAPNEFRITSWGDPPPSEDGAVLRFYVNSRRGDMSVRAANVVVECKPIELVRPLRFDAYCDLALRDVPATNAVDLIRRDGFNIESQSIRILR